jgi:hypothetical protein
MVDDDDPESGVVPIWPGMRRFGFRTASAAYRAVKRGVLPPEAFVKIGKVTKIKKSWIDAKLGEGAMSP